MKPFIHLFSTSIGYYIYDVNTDVILKISKEVYDMLNGKEIELKQKETVEYINKLKEYGFLKSSKVRESEHPDTKYLKYYCESKLENIILQITQNCNLRCKYCVYSGSYKNRVHSNKRMSIEVAKKGIDFLINHSGERSEISISFYGGEPLLEFDLIKKCILYTEGRVEGKKVIFNFTTNLTLLNEDILKFLVDHEVLMMVSLDGPKEIHDQYRQFIGGEGTFDTIYKNIMMINKLYPEYYKKCVNFNTVFASCNYNCVEKFVSKDKLFNHINFLSSLVNNTNRIEKVDVRQSYYEESNYSFFIGYLYRIGRLKKKTNFKLLESAVLKIGESRKGKVDLQRTSLPEKWHHGGPCIPGVLRLFIDVEGNFFPCEKVSEYSKNMNIGNLTEGYFIKKIENALNIERLNGKKCHNCWAYQDCQLCVGCIDSEFSVEEFDEKCQEIKYEVENEYKDYCTLKELGVDFECDHI